MRGLHSLGHNVLPSLTDEDTQNDFDDIWNAARSNRNLRIGPLKEGGKYILAESDGEAHDGGVR